MQICGLLEERRQQLVRQTRFRARAKRDRLGSHCSPLCSVYCVLQTMRCAGPGWRGRPSSSRPSCGSPGPACRRPAVSSPAWGRSPGLSTVNHAQLLDFAEPSLPNPIMQSVRIC